MEKDLDQKQIQYLSKKVLEGSASDVELKALNEWYHSFDDREVEIDSSEKKETIKQRILKSLKGIISYKKSGRFPWKGLFFKLAACLVFLVVAAMYFLHRYYEPNKSHPIEEISFHTKSTGAGEKLTVIMSDGSSVKLNANSSISFPKEFQGDTRSVSLTGEAFFSIQNSDTSPLFVVQTGKLETSVLGTKFNVRAVPGEQHIWVTVSSGKVLVESSSYQTSNRNRNGSASGIILTRNHQARFDNSTHKLIEDVVDTELYTYWVKGILSFQNASESDVFRSLENWYGVEIEVKGRSKQTWNLVGTYDNKSLEFVLESIGYAMDFDFQFSEDKKKVEITF